MIPSITYRGFVAIDDTEENESCKLGLVLAAKVDSKFADHNALAASLHLGIKSGTWWLFSRKRADLSE